MWREGKRKAPAARARLMLGVSSLEVPPHIPSDRFSLPTYHPTMQQVRPSQNPARLCIKHTRKASHNFALPPAAASASRMRTIALPHVFRCSSSPRPAMRFSSVYTRSYTTGLTRFFVNILLQTESARELEAEEPERTGAAPSTRSRHGRARFLQKGQLMMRD
jgi:hypothetical protein